MDVTLLDLSLWLLSLRLSSLWWKPLSQFNMASLLSFPRVWIRRTLSFNNSKCSCVVSSNILSTLSVHWELNWFLVWFCTARPSLNPLNHLILLLFWVRGATRFEIYAHYTRHLFEWIYHEGCVGLSVCLSVEKITPFVKIWRIIHHRLRHRAGKEGWAFMTGLRYCPLHVTEFCGEMQGKFKVGLARLTRQQNVRFLHISVLSFIFEKKLLL